MRLTDNDRKFAGITYGRSSFDSISLSYSSGGGDSENYQGNHLMVYAFGWCARIPMPRIVRPLRIKQKADTWDAATVARLGRDWYYEEHEREYGFSLTKTEMIGCKGFDFLRIFYGAQTNNSRTDKTWAKFLPWKQWRFVRCSFHDLSGNETFREVEGARLGNADHWKQRSAAKDATPKARFNLIDYDGAKIVATTMIEEREWRFGDGWFKWLSWFRKPMICRSLDIDFSSEVGPEKGSWKGGTLGHGIDMLPGELHEAAFKRYCEQEHSAKGRKYRITFAGRAE